MSNERLNFKFSREELKDVSTKLFLQLCQDVKGHVFTRANWETDSIYVNIKKGSLNFECGVFYISEYGRRYAKIDYDDLVEWIRKKVHFHYKRAVLDKYFKNQPNLTLKQLPDPTIMTSVKEGEENEIPERVSSSEVSGKDI